MHVIATFDQPMINQWDAHQIAIQERLSNMQRNLAVPYNSASLPTVEHPETHYDLKAIFRTSVSTT